MTPDRRDEIALRTVSVVVVGSLALALAGLTWRLTGWDDGRSEVAVAESLPPVGAQTGGADADVARILALAPFGGGAAAVGADGLAQSSLGLVLKGVLMAYPPAASTALIAVGDGPAAIFGIGQSPIGGATIESIGMDHVVLLNGQTRERLDFPEPVVTGVPGNAAVAAAPAAQPTQLSVQAQAALASASPIATAAAQAQAQAQAQAAPAVSAGAPPNVGQTAAALGVAATAQGYRIGANPSPELRRFGLQPGDVIESVNGQPVGNASSDQQLFETARSSGTARVVVVRGGRRLTLSFPLR